MGARTEELWCILWQEKGWRQAGRNMWWRHGIILKWIYLWRCDMKLPPWASVYLEGHPPFPHPLGQPNWCCSGLLQLNSSCSFPCAALCCTKPVDHSWAVPRSCLYPLVAQIPLPGIVVPGVHVGSLPGSSLCLFSPCPWWRDPLISRVGGVIWLKIILLSSWFGCHARSKVVLQNARDSDALCGSCGSSMAWGLELRKVNVCWGIPPIPSSKFPSVHAFLQINCSANPIESCNVLKLDLG